MSALPPDYDADPGRWRSWEATRDVHHTVAAELTGPVLDIGCGHGRLGGLLPPSLGWIGVDASPTLLREAVRRPVVQADMRRLPFSAGRFAAAVHLWCLYHVDDPLTAIREAHRVLRPGGRYLACTSARSNDPELMPAGYPATSFDAEEAADLVGTVFDRIEVQRWDQVLYSLSTRAEVRAYGRHHHIPAERTEAAELPVRLTKRGVLIRAVKT